jgi:hypothetical protein
MIVADPVKPGTRGFPFRKKLCSSKLKRKTELRFIEKIIVKGKKKEQNNA